MPKRRNSKAAWRALADDVADAVRAPSAREDAATKTNDALFYVDRAGGGGGDSNGARGRDNAGTKRERARQRALKIDAACEKAPAARAYPTPVKLRAGKMCNPPPSRALEAVRVKGKAKPVVKGAGSKGKKADGVFDVWASKAPRARGVNKLARKLTAPTTNAKAVAPEHPGCSFNPPKDAREDVVAVALAKEFKAKQARYLDPVTVPVSNVVAEANLVNELYFESGFGEDETDDEDGDGDGKLSINPAVNADKYTRTKRNKLKRRAEAEAIEQANKKAKQLRRDLSNLKALNKEIEAEEEERKANLARRNAVRAERRASQPSRLGKLRHKEADADVRFADELDGGSLRTLKPGVSLLRDRLKSYERREIIEPRRKIERKKAKAVMKYEPGARGEKEIELMVAAEKSKQRISELRALVAAGDRGAS